MAAAPSSTRGFNIAEGAADSPAAWTAWADTINTNVAVLNGSRVGTPVIEGKVAESLS
ncbi:MAG: hypothetical protein M3545_17255 [Acidobacteriota bacterium]|nr:hypothetical protein [Acidobacteriota bacterium]